jgi:ABC-2 type transport system ATP-binding protein
VLDVVELRDRAKDRVGGYSHGMRQRLGIAASLLRDPKLLLLDEPTTGLDPAGMRDMRELVKRLAGEGITILLSSHILAEVEELCNRVAIIRRGTIIYEGLLKELLSSAGGSYRLATTDPGRARAVLLARGFDGVQIVGDELRFQADVAAIEGATVALGEAGIGISALVPHTATLEELFLGMTDEHEAVA